MFLVGEKKRALPTRVAALFACRLNELSELYRHVVVCVRGARFWVVYGEQIHETPPAGKSSVAGVGFGLAWSGGRGVEDAHVRQKAARRLLCRAQDVCLSDPPQSDLIRNLILS